MGSSSFYLPVLGIHYGWSVGEFPPNSTKVYKTLSLLGRPAVHYSTENIFTWLVKLPLMLQGCLIQGCVDLLQGFIFKES